MNLHGGDKLDRLCPERHPLDSTTRGKPRSGEVPPNHLMVLHMVEPSGIEPLTSCLQGRRSPS